MKLLLLSLFSILLLSSSGLHAQTSCTVALESLKGTYEGDCVKGKAEGQGKALGSDSYEGSFKNGLPDGLGKYGYKNQNYYIGNMKKGMRDGKGEMHYLLPSGKDSVQVGYWKKDVYVGLYEKQYEIINTSGRIARVNCRISNKKGDNINFTVNSLTGANVQIANILPVSGSFYRQNTQKMNSMSSTQVQRIDFPFRAIFSLSNGETTEILFNEKAEYDVEIQVM